MLGSGVFALAILGLSGATARATTINFEQYASGTAVTNQYAGVVFAGATEEHTIDLPVAYAPHSGTGFLDNVGTGQISATFSTPESAVSGWYSSWGPLTISAYNAAHVLLSTETYAATGLNSVMWSVSLPSFSELIFSGAAGTVSLDDVSSTPVVQSAATPEPGSLLLLGTGLLGCSGLCVLKAAREKREVA